MKKKGPREGPSSASRSIAPTGPPVAALPLPRPSNPFRGTPLSSLVFSLSVSLSKKKKKCVLSPSPHPRLSLSGRRPVSRRRPKPGAEAFIGFFAGHEHRRGIPTPSLLFPSCCAKLITETLTILAIRRTSELRSFCKRYWVFTHVPYWIRPCDTLLMCICGKFQYE